MHILKGNSPQNYHRFAVFNSIPPKLSNVMIPDDSHPKKNRFQQAGSVSCLHLHKFQSENEPIEALESQIEMLGNTVFFHFCVTEKTPCFFPMLDISTSTNYTWNTDSQLTSCRFKTGHPWCTPAICLKNNIPKSPSELVSQPNKTILVISPNKLAPTVPIIQKERGRSYQGTCTERRTRHLGLRSAEVLLSSSFPGPKNKRPKNKGTSPDYYTQDPENFLETSSSWMFLLASQKFGFAKGRKPWGLQRKSTIITYINPRSSSFERISCRKKGSLHSPGKKKNLPSPKLR